MKEGQHKISIQERITDEERILLNYLAKPEEWPNWPILPVKNRKETQHGQFPLVGVVFACDPDTQPIKVYLINMFQVQGTDLSQVPSKEYANPTAMAVAGWVVD